MENKNNNNNKKGYKFGGIESPNFTQVPNVFLDELMSELKGSELKVLMYITRRAFGFRKKSDNLSLNCSGVTPAPFLLSLCAFALCRLRLEE